jgi:hypothetical protein
MIIIFVTSGAPKLILTFTLQQQKTPVALGDRGF